MITCLGLFTSLGKHIRLLRMYLCLLVCVEIVGLLKVTIVSVLLGHYTLPVSGVVNLDLISLSSISSGKNIDSFSHWKTTKPACL